MNGASDHAKDSANVPLARILLVEDDPAQLTEAWRALEGMGYAVTPAESAERALAVLESARFDLVLTDNILPGMTAFQALPRLLASGSPVIVMSSQYGPETEKDACLLGASAFVKKPLDFKNLNRCIGQALGSRAGRS